MVVPGLSPTPTPTPTSSSSSSSSSSLSSATSSSTSKTSSSEPRQYPEITASSQVDNTNDTTVDVVIDLCSDNSGNVASCLSVSSFGDCDESSSSDEEEDEEALELKLVGELQEVQRSLSRKLDTLESNVKKRKLRKELEPKKEVNGGEGEASKLLDQQQEVRDDALALAIMPSTSMASVPRLRNETCTVSERELKRKLEMVTAELSKSRMEQVKKLRKATVPERMAIEVLEFPKEYYDQMLDVVVVEGEIEEWYLEFNRYINLHKRPEYCEWVQTRTTEFLPEVLKIMTTVWSKDTPAASKLTATDLLHCRLVSKPWKRSVDKLIQEPYQNFNSYGDGVLKITTKLMSTDYTKLGDLACNYNFVTMFDPFPSRSVTISTCSLERTEYTTIFNCAIELLLQMHGKDILHFAYHAHDNVAQPFFDVAPALHLDTWVTLWGWLKKMPNLKSLQLYVPPLVDTEGFSTNSTIVRAFPFPSLTKLVVFEHSHAPNFLMKSFFSHNKTIEKLKCFQPSGKMHPKWNSTNETLSKLSEFSLNVLKMSHVLPLANVSWPLRKLTLSSCGTFEERINLGILFKTVETFEKTLQELNMKLWITSSENNLRLQLFHLKKLDLYLMECPTETKISYDFLLPLNKLEMLKLVFEREIEQSNEMEEMVQVIQFYGFIDQLYHSNVWKLFPCLKNVEATAFSESGGAKEFSYFRDELSL